MTPLASKRWIRRILEVTALLAAALVTAIAVHWRDDAQETSDVKALVAKYDGLGYANMLADYAGHTAISKAIRDGKPDAAKCEADLRASFEYDMLKQCLAQSTCASAIKADVPGQAPELLANQALPFKHYRDSEPCS